MTLKVIGSCIKQKLRFPKTIIGPIKLESDELKTKQKGG